MRLHVVDEGPSDAPVVVLLCSLGSTVDMWAPQRRELAGEYRVLTMDTLGHGGSPVPDGPYFVEDLADDVLETLDHLEVDVAAFVGVSLGGAMSQAIALRVPERVSALALICTSAQFANLDTFVERAETARAEGVAAIADGVVARWFTDDFKDSDPATVRQMRDMIAATPAEGYAAAARPSSRGTRGPGSRPSRHRRW